MNRLKRPREDAWPFQAELHFPKGLLGFEHYTRYVLIGHQQEKPFLRLEVESRAFSFFVIDPFLEHVDYTPTLTQQDLQDLDVLHEAKLFMLSIVNTNEHPYTMNLAAPLLIHWAGRLGKQLLFPEDNAYPLVSILDT